MTLGEKEEVTRCQDYVLWTVKRLVPGVNTPLDVLSLRKKIFGLKPDVVHVHGTWYPYSTLVPLIQRQYPTVLTVHGIIGQEAGHWEQKNLRSRLASAIGAINEALVLRRAGDVIIVSPALESYIPARDHKHVRYIPNGFDALNQDFLASKPDDRHRSDVFFIGRLSRRKGIDVLIKAVPALKARFPDIRVCVAGSGPLEGSVRASVRELKLEENVVLLGQVSEREKYCYLKSARLCAVPSRFEAFGIIILEAMACGRPVVASNVAGIPHVVEDGRNGLLFTPENHEELAEKITCLLSHPEALDEMSASCVKTVRDKYLWSGVAGEIDRTYRRLRKRKTAAPAPLAGGSRGTRRPG